MYRPQKTLRKKELQKEQQKSEGTHQVDKSLEKDSGLVYIMNLQSLN